MDVVSELVLCARKERAVAPPTSPSATIAPDSVVRNIPARLNDSFHESERDARRLQCSVDRIWRRIDGDAPPVSAALSARWAGPGSAPIAAPATRSKDIWRGQTRGRARLYGAAGMSDTNHAFMATGLIVRP